MKSIREMSEQIGVSKVSIYKKINYTMADELCGHVFKDSGKTMIDDEGERLIVKSLRREKLQDIDLNAPSAELDELVKPRFGYDELIETLREQLEVKDNQINDLLRQNTELVETFNQSIKPIRKPFVGGILGRFFG